MAQFRCEPIHRNISATKATSGASDYNRCRVDSIIPQILSKYLFDEFFFRISFHGNGDSDQGRPPSRFFCQSSPGVKLSSSHDW